MSKLLLVLAVLCFASMAAADTTTITSAYFTSGTTCQGTNFTMTYTAGECKSAAAGQGSAYYCSTDGKYVYQVAFSDASCNATYATTITQLPTTCGGAGTANYLYSCTNPSAGPALPAVWSFPPSGWAQSTYCFNTTSYKGTCGTGSDVSCIQSASAPQGCVKTKLPNQPSSLSGCVGTSTDSATVFYSDETCTGTVVGAVTASAAGCVNGVTASCSSANAISAASLPTIGYQSWTNTACDSVANKPTTILFFEKQCFSQQLYTCNNNVNGTVLPTLSTFVSSNCSGTAATTESSIVDKCIVGTTTSKKFQCTIAPTPTGAASSTGASMVAMIVAAIVALIASLSL